MASEKKASPHYSTLREYFVTTVVCTIFALFVTTYVVHPMTVPTPSMVPTILVGDRLLIDKFTIRNEFVPGLPLSPAHDVKRKDILVFKFPEQPEVLYVKRLIGLPGETLEIRDKTVYINGQPLDEPYKVHSDPTIFRRQRGPHFFQNDLKRDNFGPVKIPEGKYFMMGDNRDNSADSRYFGFLPREYVVGRPLLVFWSYEDADNAYRKTSPGELIQLYTDRIIHFLTRTRWTRTGHLVR
ncbi:MAG: signal peptidase I [Acidobacteriota bacterium]